MRFKIILSLILGIYFVLSNIQFSTELAEQEHYLKMACVEKVWGDYMGICNE